MSLRLFDYVKLTSAAALLAAALATPAAAQQKLNVAVSSVSLLFGPLYAAKELGFFKREGLDVEIIDLKGGPKDLAAVAGGSAAICACATTSIINAEAKGVDFSIIGTVLDQYDTNLIIQGDIAKKHGLTPLSAFADKAKALKGLTIGVTNPGSGTDQMLRFIAKEAGIDPDREMTITYVGSPSAAVAAFERKRIDGFLMSSPSAQTAEVKANGVIIIRPARGHMPVLRDLLYVSLTARKDWLAKNGETARKFMSAYQKGLDALHAEPNKARDLVFEANFKLTDRDVFNKAWTDALLSYAKDAKVDPVKGEKLVEFFNASSNAKITFDPSIVDNRFAGGTR